MFFEVSSEAKSIAKRAANRGYHNVTKKINTTTCSKIIRTKNMLTKNISSQNLFKENKTYYLNYFLFFIFRNKYLDNFLFLVLYF